MSVCALIFDCDGTLADTMPVHYIGWRQTLARHGINFPEDRFYTLAGMPTTAITTMLADEQGRVVEPESVALEKEQAFIESIDLIEPIPWVRDVAQEHRGRMPMAVGTGSVRAVLNRVLSQLGMTDWFDAVVTAEDTERHKPGPDVFLEAARRMNVAPDKCRVYEDSDLGIEAAHRAGMETVDIREFHTPRRIT